MSLRLRNVLLVFCVAGCGQVDQQSGKVGDDTKPLYRNAGDPRLAWDKCIFELDKVEALRGRNLDDLDFGGSVARNQFMVDCMTSQNVVMSSAMMDELGKYAASKRSESAMSLNNGTRRLPAE